MERRSRHEVRVTFSGTSWEMVGIAEMTTVEMMAAASLLLAAVWYLLLREER